MWSHNVVFNVVSDFGPHCIYYIRLENISSFFNVPIIMTKCIFGGFYYKINI